MRGKPPSTVTVRVPLKLTIRGGRKTIIGANPELPHTPPRTRFDDSIAKALARAYRWKKKLDDAGVSYDRDATLDPYSLLPKWLQPRKSA